MPSPMIHVIDDEEPVRENLSSLLRSVGYNVEVYRTPEEFFSTPRANVPGCILLDLKLGQSSGLDMLSMLASEDIKLPVLFMSGHGDVRTTVRAMKGGAIDFLTKPLDENVLLAAVEAAVELDAERLQEASDLQELRDREASLTPREREVAVLVASGLMNKQIAAKLGISQVTVKLHRSSALQKLQIRCVPALVIALQHLGSL